MCTYTMQCMRNTRVTATGGVHMLTGKNVIDDPGTE